MNINNPTNSQIPALRTLWKEAFGDTDEFLDIFFRTAFHPKRCRCIFDGERAVAALYWFDCTYADKPVAYIYAVATAGSHRGQGLCRKLMADTHNHLATHGYEAALLVPGSKVLFEMYGKMGYAVCSSIREFHCEANSEDLLLLEIDKYEYAHLRKFLLPAGSVLQEHENLDFLETLTKFYMGHGFLLAAHGEGPTLFGYELLGDKSHAPAIVHSLGFSEGIFRTPGGSRPFAMYYPLTDSGIVAPSYFGFAYD